MGSRGSPGLPFMGSCLPPVDRPRPVARSKPGLHTSFLPTTTSTSLTQRDFNSNPEETKNVFPTACHRLLHSLPCLSPSLQPEHDHLAKRREWTSPQLGNLALQRSHAEQGCQAVVRSTAWQP